MNQTVVLDASALLAIALHEPGGEAVLERIKAAPGNVIIHAINVFEVVNKLMEKGMPEAEAWESAEGYCELRMSGSICCTARSG